MSSQMIPYLKGFYRIRSLISDLEEAWNCIEVLSYILILTSVDYAKNYRQNSFSGIVGSVTEVDDIEIDYHLRVGDNRILELLVK
ncbi:MAG: hypothetical protein CM15mP75_3350 [Flammeovirgaceae bacterium]|nr:MAG: hypothetical protein CM15mP75_3350 [Flammeovirgaceae bacterium]